MLCCRALAPAPVVVVIGWTWQEPPGQCWSRISQLRLVFGIVPSSASAAEPEKSMLSPTLKVRPVSGRLMVAVGGVFGAAVVKLQTRSVASAFPTRSFAPPAPPLTVAV